GKRTGTGIDETEYRAIRHRGMLRESDLAGPRGRVAARALARQCLFQMSERVVVELGTVKPFVAREPAAQDPLRGNHIAAATSCDRGELLDRAHLSSAAHRVHSDRLVPALDRNARQDLVVEEFDAVEDGQASGKESPHAIRARARIECDGDVLPATCG